MTYAYMLSFNLDKIGDYLANAYLSMTMATLLYMLLRALTQHLGL